ncbi:MAG: sulfatase [Phycisphaerae bacterium]|nr:sulfatase [Phycisphaerae bacterium]
MHDQPNGIEESGSEHVVTPPVRAGRWGSGRRIVVWSVRTGLIGGLLFGLAQSLVLGWPHRGMMGARQWSDVLTYSGAAHGVLWALYGCAMGLAWATVVVVSRRARDSIRPGALSVAAFASGGSAFVLWPAAAILGVSLAEGVQRPWCLVMAAYWVVSFVTVCVVAHWLARTWLARPVCLMGRVGFIPAAGVVVVCGAVQWFERPRLWPPAEITPVKSDEAAGEGRRRPNVVLVVLDTQRADRTGCYGYGRDTTPNLDAFAEDATVFERCVSTSNWTLPVHASMFTGLYPSEHGATWNHRWLDDGFVTVAELLKEAGYETFALSNNDWISTATNLSQGFDRVVRPESLYRARGNSVAEFVEWVLRPAGWLGPRVGALTSQDAGAKYTNQLVARWLGRRDRDRPFFLFINYMEPHDPYQPHLPYRRQFVRPEELDASYRLVWSWRKTVAYSLLKREAYTADELRLCSEKYDGEIRQLDDRVGELLKTLARQVGLDDCLIIITSDHGENLGEHHSLIHAWNLYETLVHVPLIVRYPRRLTPGRRLDTVQPVDFLPTIVDAVTRSPAVMGSTFGRSLLPSRSASTQIASTTRAAVASTQATQPVGRAAIVELMAPGGIGTDVAQRIDVRFDRSGYEGPARAITLWPWKYIVSGDGREALYRLDHDQGESENVVKAKGGEAQRLAEQLRQWLGSRRVYRGEAQLTGQQGLGEEMRRRLRNLGYIQ